MAAMRWDDHDDSAVVTALIERSSLGTAGARQLRERIPQAEADFIRHLVRREEKRPRGPLREQELVEAWRDPGIRRIAVWHAGSEELADDALQEAYYRVRQVRDPDHISDLRGFFRRVLIDTCSRQSSRRQRLLFLEELEAEQQEEALATDAVSLQDEVASKLALEAVIRTFRDHRDRLTALVARRSPEPARYQDAIVNVGLKYYLGVRQGSVTTQDLNAMLKDAFPGWFLDTRRSADTSFQRLSRGRADMRALLQAVVSKADL